MTAAGHGAKRAGEPPGMAGQQSGLLFGGRFCRTQGQGRVSAPPAEGKRPDEAVPEGRAGKRDRRTGGLHLVGGPEPL